MIAEFFEQLDSPFTAEELFDHIPDTVFFIKNSAGQYLVVNQTLVDRCRLKGKRDLLGKTAGEVLRPPLGNGFSLQDQHLLASGEPLLSQLELHMYASGDVGWCLTTKLPLHDRLGAVTGIVGVSKDLQFPDIRTGEYNRLAEAIRHAETNLTSPPSVLDLAEIADMSRYQFDRRIRLVFGLTAGQWLIKIRIDVAQRLLSETEKTISSISLEAGYSDQSAFTRQFRRSTGLSPGEFREARKSGLRA